MAGYNNNAVGTWECSCGKTNTGKFCVSCGSQRPATPASSPASQAEWVCSCGRVNTGKFCVECGTVRPAAESGKVSGSNPSPQEVRQPKAFHPANGTVTLPPRSNKSAGGIVMMPPRGNKSAGGTVMMPPRGNKPVGGTVMMPPGVNKTAIEEAAARQAAEARAAQEETVRKAEKVQAEQVREASSDSEEADRNKGMLMKVAIGVAVLLLLIGAYFMFGRKKEAPPAPETPKAETKAGTEKQMDPAAKEEKLKEYAAAVKAANEQKKQDAAANEKLVFLIEDVQRAGNDLVISGHFYNGKKNRTIISVKALKLDIVLRDMDKELLNEKNITYDKAFTGMNIEPLNDSQQMTVNLPGKAPAGEFNNFTVTAHDVHWEGVGK